MTKKYDCQYLRLNFLFDTNKIEQKILFSVRAMHTSSHQTIYTLLHVIYLTHEHLEDGTIMSLKMVHMKTIKKELKGFFCDAEISRCGTILIANTTVFFLNFLLPATRSF